MKIVKEDNGNVLVLLKEKEIVQEMKYNNVDASFEKHLPQFRVKDNKVEVFVDHVMEEDHYIEWILVDYGNSQVIKHFKPGEECVLNTNYEDGMIAYSFCNKHGLWMNKLEDK